MSEVSKPFGTEVKFNKNGYEIRSDILRMATDIVQAEYQTKILGWELSSKRDDKGVITTTVGMPEFPGIDKVLDTAKKLYEFVSASTDRK
jgi:hypothetical protein